MVWPSSHFLTLKKLVQFSSWWIWPRECSGRGAEMMMSDQFAVSVGQREGEKRENLHLWAVVALDGSLGQHLQQLAQLGCKRRRIRTQGFTQQLFSMHRSQANLHAVGQVAGQVGSARLGLGQMQVDPVQECEVWRPGRWRKIRTTRRSWDVEEQGSRKQ